MTGGMRGKGARNVRWHAPVPKRCFVVTQEYLNKDWSLYTKFGRHPGVDYGAGGRSDIPLYACADGEIIHRGVVKSRWGRVLGNHLALYVPSENVSFLYCHLADTPRALGVVTSGEKIGIMGNTGKVLDGAIHLHLEAFYGRFDIKNRDFKSLADEKAKTFNADAFLREKLGM